MCSKVNLSESIRRGGDETEFKRKIARTVFPVIKRIKKNCESCLPSENTVILCSVNSLQLLPPHQLLVDCYCFCPLKCNMYYLECSLYSCCVVNVTCCLSLFLSLCLSLL